LFALISIPVHAQDVFARNSKYVDYVFDSVSRYFCNGDWRFSETHVSPRKLKHDLKIIEFVNDFFQKELDSTSIDSIATSLKFDTKHRESSYNGLIVIHTIYMPVNYMRAVIKFESIGGHIYRRYCEISTSSYCYCGLHLVDFRLLKEYYLKNIKFPLSFKVDFFDSDTISINTLKTISENYPYNKFNLPGNDLPDWLNTIYCNQYNSDKTYLVYNSSFVDLQFIQLVKRERIDAIESLLYSPNYLYAINAMEPLIYLQSLNKVTLSDSIKKKMEEIKNSNYSFFSQSSDVVHFMENYGKLYKTDEEIIYKYRKAVSQR